MKKAFQKVKKQFFVRYHKLQSLPRWIKYSLGILLIVIGAVNIVNPFLNGIFIIILGASLLSETFYERFKARRCKDGKKIEKQEELKNKK